jgi:hypothetical protein
MIAFPDLRVAMCDTVCARWRCSVRAAGRLENLVILLPGSAACTWPLLLALLARCCASASCLSCSLRLAGI